MEYYFLSIGMLLLGAIISLITAERFKIKICSLFAAISSIFALIPSIAVLKTGEAISSSINSSLICGQVDFVIDSLSAFFILIISIMSLLGLIYANGYLSSYFNKSMPTKSHCFFLMLLIASMLSVVTVNNGLFFLVVWELMSLSSFFLVIYEGEKKEVLKAGIKYLVYMHLSVIFIIAMFAILTNASQSLSFAEYAKALTQNPQLAELAFILGFVGFGIKAGFVPFHNWLPDAHPAAPTHVSGIMSGVMIKTGIYGILRTLYLVGFPTKFVSYMVLTIAVISVLYGILYALTQKDIKKLLAYSSIENIGIMGVGIGIGMLGLSYGNPLVSALGFTGGILHVLNHSIFKELMFFGAGSIYTKTHTRDMEELGGLMKKMPKTGFLFIIGSIAICGLPPFNGFISEFLIYAGMLMGIPASELGLFIVLVISIAALAMVGTMAMLCFTKLSGITLLGAARTEKAEQVDSDVTKDMLFPMSLLAFASFMIGMYPQYFIGTILQPVSLFVDKVHSIEIFKSIEILLQNISFMFFLLMVILLSLCALRAFMKNKSEEHETWGCGYDRPNSHMQYTASSFANLFVSTLKPLFKRVSHIKKPKDLFPKDAYYELEIEDIEEAYIVKPLLKWDEKILSKFERIQNGNIQQYILFGLIFLVVAIVGLIILG